MEHFTGGSTALDYYPCRYNGSRVVFRGPRKALKPPYIAFLGSTETYGRFIPTPFPDLVEQELQTRCINFGVINAGVDLYANEPAILTPLENAQATVLQIMGAQYMSNRYYHVHPRRNDRFLRASAPLTELFPEVDFTEFHFIRHMLTRLRDICVDRYTVVIEEIRTAWVARMKTFLGLLRGRVVLVWISDMPMPDQPTIAMGRDPLFIHREMIKTLGSRVHALAEIVAEDPHANLPSQGMVFRETEVDAAAKLPGPELHRRAADALVPILTDLLR